MGKLYMEEKINECICVSDEQPKLEIVWMTIE